MTERPILFSGPMVRAILSGDKTQTRRVVGKVVWDENEEGKKVPYSTTPGAGYDHALVAREFPARWQVGDRLWVRETFALESCHEAGWYPPRHSDGRPLRTWDDEYGEWWEQPHYRATDPEPDLVVPGRDGPGVRWTPSIHMPRWASRITLEVTEVRVQRLQEISEGDAEDEGTAHWVSGQATFYANARTGFAAMWDAINHNPAYRWDANPYVWAISFHCLEATR